MLPKGHIIIGLVFSAILVYFFNFSLLAGFIIFISSFLLIDLDHYLLYVYRKKQLNPFKFYRDSLDAYRRWALLTKKQKESYKLNHYIFHGIEPLIIIALLIIFNNIFLWILVGFIVHLITDYLDLTIKKEHLYPKISHIYLYKKNKGKKSFK